MLSLKKITAAGLSAYAMLFASVASAADASSGWGYSSAPTNVPTNLENAIMNITNYILGFIAIIATLIVIYGGVRYLTAMGNDDEVGKAKKTIYSGIIGIVICGLAYAIVTIVFSLLGTAV